MFQLENTSKVNSSVAATKFQNYCPLIYLFLISSICIICIIVWSGIWSVLINFYGENFFFINPLSIFSGILGAVTQKFSELLISPFSNNSSTRIIDNRIYFIPVIGAILGLLSFLMIHSIVDRFVLSAYGLDLIAIALVSFFCGFKYKPLLNRFMPKLNDIMNNS